MSDVFTRLDNIEEALTQHADAIKALGGHVGTLLASHEPDILVVDQRISGGTLPPRRPFTPPNRWAAFTDDELDALESILSDYLGDSESITWTDEAAALQPDIWSEIRARAAQRTEPA